VSRETAPRFWQISYPEYSTGAKGRQHSEALCFHASLLFRQLRSFGTSTRAITRRANGQKEEQMKNARILYWIVTGLAAALMVAASIPDVLRNPQAISIFGHLGYPAYLLPFLGTAKLLGVGAVLVPGFRRLKEWAYAGLVFDLSGALYSHVSIGDPPSVWAFPIIGLLLVGGSYLLRAAAPVTTES
jgi:hypothetical protein